MISSDYHIDCISKSIDEEDYGAIIRHSEVLVELLDRVEFRSTLDKISKYTANLEILGHSSGESADLEKQNTAREILRLAQSLPQRSE